VPFPQRAELKAGAKRKADDKGDIQLGVVAFAKEPEPAVPIEKPYAYAAGEH
jgi:hypothetical protein